MASSGADEDLEAQTSGATVSLPTTVELEDDPPTNPPNPQPLSSADLQFQVINTSELANANPPVPQTVTVNNSEVQRGMPTVPISLLVISFVYQMRTTEILLMVSGRCTSLRLRSRTRR
jgi:hypothetical protein